MKLDIQLEFSLVSLVVRFVWESQVEWIVSRFVANAQEILALPGSLVASSVLIATVLGASSFILWRRLIN